jgi:hypothetical protein
MSFTKAVLKECRMPDNGVPALHVRKNLYGFAAEYFQGMQEQQNTRMRRGLQLSQCVRLHADLCKDRQVDTVSIMELNAYSLGFGVDRQAFKDILLLCTFKQPDSTVVQRVEFVAFACALVQCSSLGELMGHLVTIFGATPSDFFTAVAALIRIDVTNASQLQALVDSVPESLDSITMEVLEQAHRPLHSLGKDVGRSMSIMSIASTPTDMQSPVSRPTFGAPAPPMEPAHSLSPKAVIPSARGFEGLVYK